MESWPQVDVLVSTRNRARLLAAACEAILDQDYPADRWRLLIVDNVSTDDTFAVARAVADRFPGRVRAMRNDELGHSAARNAGIAECSAEIVALTDDDALPARDWLRALVGAMAEHGAAVVGGAVQLQLSGDPPPWFLIDFLPYLAIWEPGSQVLRLKYNEYPRGVNMALRREAIGRYGPFNRHLGLRGTRQLFSEETELCLRVERGGDAIVYTPASRVRHCVEASRLTPSWLTRRYRAQGRSEARMNWMHGGFRGLWLGSRVHRRNFAAISPAWFADRGMDRSGRRARCREPEQAARLIDTCRRRALLGYLADVPVVIATVSRYQPPDGRTAAPFTPL